MVRPLQSSYTKHSSLQLNLLIFAIWQLLSRYNTKWNMDLKLKPNFIGGIIKDTGSSFIIVHAAFTMTK